MNSVDLVFEGGNYYYDYLFENPYYATGLPIDQAWWAEVKVAGTYKWVLIQCFERRCLTYTPDNPPGWQVEAGNVGQHYFTWRYEDTQALSEEEYLELVWDIDDDFLHSTDILEGLLENPDINNPDWTDAVIVELDFWQLLADEVFGIVPPPAFEALHDELVFGYLHIDEAAVKLKTGLLNEDVSLVEQGYSLYLTAQDILDAYYSALPFD